MKNRGKIITICLLLIVGISCKVSQEQTAKKEGSALPKEKLTGEEVMNEDFSLYGNGQTAPFGEWNTKGNNAPRIEETVQANGKIGKVLHVERHNMIYIDKPWRDYTLEVNWKDSEPAVYFRLSDKGGKGYFVTKGLGYNSTVKLYKFAGNNKIMLAESSGMDTPGGKWHQWQIDLTGHEIKVHLNGVEMISVTDDDEALATGGIGLGSAYGGVLFDDIKVTRFSSQKVQ